ncbi:MAG: hypothetical protein M1815_001409 [Lichina confinis]|nr:MAG: hypothetical protein M1815_001409 [Lichina confinis]
MDLSIAYAFYFAARYTRHALAFSRNKFSGLLAELQLDVSRLGKRNLGRDDRVTAHWGKEVRHPYLDEDLVRWALECPIWEKCGFGQKQDPGDIEPAKKVLRLLALRLGLSGAASEKKRAVQFGARTAKMEIGKNKGTNLISVAGVALKPTDQLGSTVGYGAGTA